MQEVSSLYTDSRALRAEYCIVGISHNTDRLRLGLELYFKTRPIQFQLQMKPPPASVVARCACEST